MSYEKVGEWADEIRKNEERDLESVMEEKMHILTVKSKNNIFAMVLKGGRKQPL